MTKIFISYAHSTSDHKKAISNLVDVLRKEGLLVLVDTDVMTPQGPIEGWPKWMKQRLKEADWVLIFFDDTYKCRFDGDEELNKGLGATWEGAIITHTLYRQSAKNYRFIPLLANSASDTLIPDELYGANRYYIPRDSTNLAKLLAQNTINEAEKSFSDDCTEIECLQNSAFIYPVCTREDLGIFYGDSLNNVYWRSSDASTVKLYNHKESVTAIAVSKNNTIVSGGRDNKLIVYDFFNKQFVGEVTHGHWIYGLSFLDENTFVSGGNDGYIKIWRIIGTKIHIIYEKKVHDDRINDLLVANNRLVISCARDGSLSIFDFSNETVLSVKMPDIPYCLTYENK